VEPVVECLKTHYGKKYNEDNHGPLKCFEGFGQEVSGWAPFELPLVV
jgi:hypothetical protein